MKTKKKKHSFFFFYIASEFSDIFSEILSISHAGKISQDSISHASAIINSSSDLFFIFSCSDISLLVNNSLLSWYCLCKTSFLCSTHNFII
jgi:hypothetical protein